MNKLSMISFVGIDEQTDISDLISLSAQSKVYLEFGILYSNSRMGKDTRYPSINFIRNFIEKVNKDLDNNLFDISIHLCGGSVQEFLDGKLDHLVRGFNRIQLNFSMKDYNDDVLIEQLLKLKYVPTIILQHNKSKKKFIEKFLPHKDDMNVAVDILFDSSGGFGRVLENPLMPLPYTFCGYAGGINPKNIQDILNKIDQVVKPGDYFYIDLESGVRENNQFSIEKCKQIIQVTNEFNK